MQETHLVSWGRVQGSRNVWESLLGLESFRERVFGDRGCSEPPCGILRSFSYWYSSACEKHPRKKKKQQLFPWVFQAAIKKTVSSELSLQKSLKECYKKKIYLLPCSSIVNKLSFFFFYLVVNLTCPPRR